MKNKIRTILLCSLIPSLCAMEKKEEEKEFSFIKRWTSSDPKSTQRNLSGPEPKVKIRSYKSSAHLPRPNTNPSSFLSQHNTSDSKHFHLTTTPKIPTLSLDTTTTTTTPSSPKKTFSERTSRLRKQEEKPSRSTSSSLSPKSAHSINHSPKSPRHSLPTSSPQSFDSPRSLLETPRTLPTNYLDLLITSNDFDEKTFNAIADYRTRALVVAESDKISLDSTMGRVYSYLMRHTVLYDPKLICWINRYCLDMAKPKKPLVPLLKRQSTLYSASYQDHINCFTHLQLLMNTYCDMEIHWPEISPQENEHLYFDELFINNASLKDKKYEYPLSAGIITGLFLTQMKIDRVVKNKILTIAKNPEVQEQLSEAINKGWTLMSTLTQ